MDLTERLDRLAEMKAQAKAVTAEGKRLKEEAQAYEAELFHFMDRNGIRSIRTDNHTFTPRRTILSTVTDMDAFVRWCKDNDLLDEYIRPNEQKARLNELVREHVDNVDELPPGVGMYPKEYISATEL